VGGIVSTGESLANPRKDFIGWIAQYCKVPIYIHLESKFFVTNSVSH
jgi:hypothetical protein